MTGTIYKSQLLNLFTIRILEVDYENREPVSRTRVFKVQIFALISGFALENWFVQEKILVYLIDIS